MKIFRTLPYLFAISLFLFPSCSEKQMFHRPSAELRETKDIPLNLLKSDMDNHLYYHEKFVTFRFETKNDSLTIESELSGDINIHINCISEKKGKLIITTENSGKNGTQKQEPTYS